MKGATVNRLLYAAFVLSLLAGNAWAAGSCVRPQDVTALRTAALQQQLMVAALTCHDVAAYNRFVISHQGALQVSDKALMDFFLRQNAQTGADDYNAYKTWLANTASLRSLRDPQFCRSANIAFNVALDPNTPLTELVSERPSPVETAYARCMPGVPENILTADATPRRPSRLQVLLDSLPSNSAVAPVFSSRPDRALLRASPRDSDERQAYNRHADIREADNRDANERNDFDRDRSEARDDADAGYEAPRYVPRYTEAAPARTYDRGDDRYADDPPTADEPPAGPRMVRGRDGHWYLLHYEGR
jgi:hypothetical protein